MPLPTAATAITRPTYVKELQRLGNVKGFEVAYFPFLEALILTIFVLMRDNKKLYPFSGKALFMTLFHC